jgi:hypothetical protein
MSHSLTTRVMILSRVRRFHRLALTALLTLLVSAAPGHAACDPTTDPDKTDIANARDQIATTCDCAGARTHGAYVSCAVQKANAVLTNKSCAGAVKKCAAHSICARRAGAVTCCHTTTKGTRCHIKRDAAHCTGPQETAGACNNCCDSCPTPGSGPSCPVPTTTTTTTIILPTCNDLAGTCGTCGTGICFGPGDCAFSGPDRCVRSDLSCAPNCITNCGSDQDCAASPGTICVGIDVGGGCQHFCAPPCSPSGAFLDE